uniref:Reverse transcriptase domain-containing protein n=1 Tax=Tanacetum cinerariifolium TaxID=118510 RepID=A0A699HQC9_TANCI|nr:reverse transcriptase domain-containing protein [Tanacetum cinerariifolium]
MNTASSSGTGSLPSNTVPNPQEDLKVITTRSGVTLDGPSVSPAPLSKENLHFELSFTYALLHMPKFALMFKSLLNNKEKLFDLATTLVNENCSTVILKKLPEKLRDPDKFLIPCDFPKFDECLALVDLGASINLMPLSIWKKLSFPELTFTQMILELADRSTTRPAGIAEDIFVKVRKFYFPTDFEVVDYVVDPRVPLNPERPFLRTGRALIAVYGEEITLCVDDEAITFKVGQTLKYSYNDAESINRIDIIDVACEEYVQEVLAFFDNSKSSNPTPISDPIIALSSPFLTPFNGGDFILELIEACFTSKLIPPGINDTDLDLEGDIRLLEELLNNYPSLSHLPPKELNVEEIKTVKSSIDEPSELEPVTLLLEKETPFVFSKDCINAFDTLKKKLTEALILVVPDWNIPFELMCDASDFAIGTVLGQRKTKHFHPIHYASKTMTKAQIHYTTMEKEMLSIVYAFEKCQPYLVLSKSIVYTDHSALKYLLNKQDAKPRLIRTVGENRASWSEKLEDALWAFRTAYKTPIGCIPYKLVYGKSCHLPIELEHKAYWALKHANFDLKTAGDHRKLQFNELNELHDQAYKNSLIYKEKTKKIHDSKIKKCVFNIEENPDTFDTFSCHAGNPQQSHWRIRHERLWTASINDLEGNLRMKGRD